MTSPWLTPASALFSRALRPTQIPLLALVTPSPHSYHRPRQAVTAATKTTTTTPATVRRSHSRVPKAVPAPTPLVPDVHTFLVLIGRNLKRFADKIPTWEALFTLTTDELRELGVAPARSRKYLLRWLEKFRNGKFGAGGDLAHVAADGAAHLRVGHDLVTDRRWVVNVPLDKTRGDAPAREVRAYLEDAPREQHVVPDGYYVRGANTVVGPRAIPNPREAGGATVRIVEGMWEERRGVKLDGGERRRAMVRYQKKIAARKAEIEAKMRAEAGRT